MKIEQSNNFPVSFVGAVKWDGSFVSEVRNGGTLLIRSSAGAS